jgi:1,4-alpha-glucan branching enzyme
MWLQDCRLDGLRFDATAHIRSDDGSGVAGHEIPDGWLLLQELNDDIDASWPEKATVAEDLRGDELITAETSAGGAGFDSQWDPDFVADVRTTLELVSDEDRSMALVASRLERRLGPAAMSRVIFTESQGADGNGRGRVPTEIDLLQPDSVWSKKRSTLGAALVLTAPGIPMLLQGQEFLAPEAFLQAPPPLESANAETYKRIWSLHRDLIHLRRDRSGCTRGLRGDGLDVFHVNDVDKLIAYHRFDQGGVADDVVVVANFANRGYDAYLIGLPAPGEWRVRFNSDWTGYDRWFGGWPSYDVATSDQPRDGFDNSGSVGIGAYTAIVLSQDPAAEP